ncbi:hypothetical protein [Parabacteroides sp.]
MKAIKTYILVTVGLLSLLLAGCSSEEAVDNNLIIENKVRFELFTKPDSYGQPATRANADENNLDKTPWILVFVGGNENATFAEAVQAEVIGTKSYVYLEKQTGACQLLVLANPADKFYFNGTAYDYNKSDFTTALSGISLKDASEKMLTEPLNDPQTTLPFIGKKLVMSDLVSMPSGIAAGNSIPTITLKRTVAKMVLSSTASTSNFTLEGITAVVNTPKHSRLYNWNNSLTYANTSLINYGSDASFSSDFVQATANSTADSPIYLYESAYNSTNNDTYLIVRGTYQNETFYYKMALVANQVQLDVERNYSYEFTITAVKGRGYSTIADVMASKASNTNLDYTVLVQDNSGYEILSNNDYFLGVTNSHFELYANNYSGSEYTAFTLITDCKTPFVDKKTIKSLTTGLTIVSPTEIPLSTTAPYDVKIKLDDGFTEGKIEVHLGSLKKIITVRRQPAPSLNKTISDFIPGGSNYISAYIVNYPMINGIPDPSHWLQLSPGGEPVRNDPHSITTDNGLIDLHISFQGESDVYVSMNKDNMVQRIKVHVKVVFNNV